LSYHVPGQKPGGGATGHDKWAGRRRDPKFDDYTQNSSNLQSKFNLALQKGHKLSDDHVTIGIRNYL
jgi:hypothetical protein